MKLTGIISISGKPGLSKIISQTRTGIIVESLIDGKRAPVHGTERVSSLEDISIYTHEEDMLLSEVFEKMYAAAAAKAILSHKSSADELRNYLLGVLPNYDEERVYASDIKKLVQWYNLLLNKDLLKPEEKEKEDDDETKKATTTKVKESKKKTTQQKKPVKKATSKAAAPPKKTSPKGAAKGR